MKIAIPVEDSTMTSCVCPSFGRTPYFLIYNLDTLMADFLDNSAAASQGGAGIQAAQALVDQGVEVVITPRCGENAAAVLKAAKIDLYRTLGCQIQENLQGFKDGTLLPLSDIHQGFHHHGGR